MLKGVSANADPHYQKLYGRVTGVCSNRRGQLNLSAMKEPRPGRNPFLIRFTSPSGKYTDLKTKGHHIQIVILSLVDVMALSATGSSMLILYRWSASRSLACCSKNANDFSPNDFSDFHSGNSPKL